MADRVEELPGSTRLQLLGRSGAGRIAINGDDGRDGTDLLG